jgi:hypothetical protein
MQPAEHVIGSTLQKMKGIFLTKTYYPRYKHQTPSSYLVHNYSIIWYIGFALKLRCILKAYFGASFYALTIGRINKNGVNVRSTVLYILWRVLPMR